MRVLRRRDVVALLMGGAAAAAASQSVARAQQARRVRRIGVLMGIAEDDPRARQYLDALRASLHALGWSEGQNVRIDFRGAPDLAGIKARAAELAGLAPEVVVTQTTPATSAIRQAAPAVPIIFIAVSDPIAAGFVHSIPHPGGTITGFTNFEASMGSKWLELLRDIAPSVRRVAMLFNPGTANTGAVGGIYLPSMQAGAKVLGVELIAAPVSEPTAIDGVFAGMASSPGGGVSVMPNVFTAQHRERIVAEAARHRIPTVYPLMHFVEAGGLMSYGIDYVDQFRRAASHADRILKGTKPADLPVEQPVKFELAINRKTAAALGLPIPLPLQVAADQMIE
jgi:ABC-type uncharacterized transport system substrate-binding protein